MLSAASNTHRKQPGFTIVELLIVIVIIAILASITIVSYTGIQQRAREVALRGDLKQASTYLELERLNNDSYPESDANIPKSPSTEYEYRPNGASYCLAARTTGSSTWTHHVTDSGAVSAGSCQGVEYAGQPPAGVNLMPPFSQWSLHGGATYDAETQEVTLPQAGSWVRSPLVRVDGPASWRFSAEMYGPPSSAEGSNGRTETYMTSRYYDVNQAPYTVQGGWTTNGHAPWVEPANTWTNATWDVNSAWSGPGLMYIRFDIDVDASYGVPGTKYRNPELTVER